MSALEESAKGHVLNIMSPCAIIRATIPSRTGTLRAISSMIAKRVILSWLVLGGLVSLLSGATTTLIERGGATSWRYLDDRTGPAAEWTSVAFDDAAWRRGPAPLGYGEPEIATTLSFGARADEKPMAAYFRREFEVTDAVPAARHAIIEMRIDDGVIVYLNGREIVRQNMPAGVPTVKTGAAARVEGPEEREYARHVLPAAALRPGRNVLAAEVHQVNAVSSDLFFDLRLTVSDEAPPVRLAKAAREATLAYHRNHRVPPTQRIADGYVDGGRNMKIGADGTVTSRRELIVVDRARDEKLRRHLEYARWLKRADLPAAERAVLLAQYVDLQFSPPEGRGRAEQACEIFVKPLAGKEVLIGELTHAGVCRHRALVFKILGDEAGLSVALVRGNLGKGGAHVWNEWVGADGEKRIVDVMNPEPAYRFPKITDRAAANYLTVTDAPYYAPAGATN